MISNYFPRFLRNLPSWTLNWKGKNPEITLTASQNSMCFVRRVCLVLHLRMCVYVNCNHGKLVSSAIAQYFPLSLNQMCQNECVYSDCFIVLNSLKRMKRTHYMSSISKLHSVRFIRVKFTLNYPILPFSHSVFLFPTINNRQWSNPAILQFEAAWKFIFFVIKHCVWY